MHFIIFKIQKPSVRDSLIKDGVFPLTIYRFEDEISPDTQISRYLDRDTLIIVFTFLLMRSIL